MEALATRSEGWTCRIWRTFVSSMIGTDREEESGSPRQLSRRISPSGARSPWENFFGVTFSLNQCCTELILLRPWCSQSTLQTALQCEFIEWPSTQQLGRSNHPTKTRDVQSLTGTALFRFNSTPSVFPPCAYYHQAFLPTIIFYKLLHTGSVERKPLPSLTKLLHSLHGLSFEKVTAVIWGSEKRKDWGINRLQIKFMVLKLCYSC